MRANPDFPKRKGRRNDGSWEDQLLKTRSGEVRSDLANVLTVLGRDPRWLGVFAYDAFTHRVTFVKEPPCRHQDASGARLGQEVQKNDATRLAGWLASEHGIFCSPKTVLEAVLVAADRNTTDSLADWLRSLVWDGTRRIDRWLQDYAGAEDRPEIQTMGALFLVGACVRALSRGSKMDNMLILEGGQGERKSQFVQALFGEKLTLETNNEVGTDKFAHEIEGKWCVELSELDSFSRTESVRAKAFLTKRVDRFRRPYGSDYGDYPRACVFMGTTNSPEYFTDATGNRRYWPVHVSGLDAKRIGLDRDQIWAEARDRAAAQGAGWWEAELDCASEITAAQEKRLESDPWDGAVMAWLSDKKYPLRGTSGVSTTEILVEAVQIPTHLMTRAHQMRIAKILKRFNWKESGANVRPRLYLPISRLEELREVGYEKVLS